MSRSSNFLDHLAQLNYLNLLRAFRFAHPSLKAGTTSGQLCTHHTMICPQPGAKTARVMAATCPAQPRAVLRSQENFGSLPAPLLTASILEEQKANWGDVFSLLIRLAKSVKLRLRQGVQDI